jgi:CheY-like chemotaxis protein
MSLDIKSLHILVVEDIAPMQDLTARLLRALGIGRVSVAANGEEGYHAYCDKKPDIVLTDWKMPAADGMKMLMQIRRGEDSPNRVIPVIMMTGFSSKDRIAEARDSGVTEFLVKPFSAKDVTKRLAAIIKNPRDFIVAPNYIGPDRRRRRDEDHPKEVERREKDAGRRIPGVQCLQKEAAAALLNPIAVERSQSVIDNDKTDFIPIVTRFLKQLAEAVEAAKSKDNPGRRELRDIIDEVMQIKANAKIFKYDLVGDLAGIMLDFLEELNEIDEFVIQIIDAHQKTLAHLIQNRVEGDGGDIGNALREELTGACKRYMRIRTEASKERFRQTRQK